MAMGPVLRGALFSCLGFTAWAFADACTKAAGLGGASLVAILCLSSWVAVATVLIGLFFRGGLGRLRLYNKKAHAIRCLIFLFSSVVNVIAFTNLPLTTVYIGIFASPFLISLCGAWFMGEPLGKRQGVIIAFGFLGVLLALGPEIALDQTGPGNPLWGYISLPFFLATFVGNNLFIRILGRTDTPESMTLVGFFVRGLVLVPVLGLQEPSAVPLSALPAIAGLGFLGGVGFLLVSLAYKLAPVAVVSSFHYTQLVTGALLGFWLWDEVPSLWVWLGGAVIIASGLLMAFEAKRCEAASSKGAGKPA